MNRERIKLLLKIVVIAVVWLLLYLPNQTAIHSIVSQGNYSFTEKVERVTRQLLNLPISSNEQTTEMVGTTQPHFTTPRQLKQAVMSHKNFQYADRVARQFNQQLDLDVVNQLLVAKINKYYGDNASQVKDVGHHLAEGTDTRAGQLSDFHYLSEHTISGESFRSLFTLPQVETRISEYLYELSMVATDVHLKTWANSEILADYLFKILERNDFFNQENDWTSQYLAIKAAASDYLVDKSAYVRLVVVLTMDNQ
ncbi:hypothetical protein I4Q36_08235 [Tuanshanicoccus lijuaniae]|uniref:hypothetical protein n=1 Tax=Aerococcaceae bacterium zg-1292 TaxID=2774330 RepID=UPI001935B36B|nr:hypothetical protein [Aerococcaceae bacterium zg-1292]QQA36774.1 hypothetical protein I4Q36_08235 [Aerococcaceae bacterium zg-1292]